MLSILWLSVPVLCFCLLLFYWRALVFSSWLLVLSGYFLFLLEECLLVSVVVGRGWLLGLCWISFLVVPFLFLLVPMPRSHMWWLVWWLSPLVAIELPFLFHGFLFPVSTIISWVAACDFPFSVSIWASRFPLLFIIFPRYLYAETSSSFTPFSSQGDHQK